MSKDKMTPPHNGGWGIITEDGKWVTNFSIELGDTINTHGSGADSKPMASVKLRLAFGDNNYSDEFIIPLSELDTTKWVDKDIRCIFNPDIAPAKAQRILSYDVRSRLPDAPEKKQYRLNRLGVHITEDEPGFCTGGGHIRPSPGTTTAYDFRIDPMPYNLDIDPNISEEEAAIYTLKLINLFPNYGRLLLAYNLMCLMWELYKTAWKAPRFCLFIYGDSNSFKTTLSSFFSQIYNRGKGMENPPRLDSSIAKAVELIYEKDHCAVLLDDLFPSEFKHQRRKQEETLSDVTRIIGDGVPPGRYGKTMNPSTVGVVFTAEYPIGTRSSAARLLHFEAIRPSHDTKRRFFTEFQNKPLMLSTFYQNFIQWFISNYEWALEFLKDCWDAYSRKDFAVEYGQEIHDRLRETHYNMSTAYFVFLEYCLDQGCITEEESEVMQQTFSVLITDLMLDQQSRVNQSTYSNIPDVKFNYLDYFSKLYVGKTFKLAPSAKEFDEAVHDGVEHLGRLYIYGERFREIVDAAGFNMDEVLDDLKAQGALYHDKDLNTTKFVVGPKDKPRCYAIKLTHLK